MSTALGLHGTSAGVSAPVVIAIAVVLAGAWLYHTLTDHHGHLWLLRVVRPSTVVPATRHDSRWHSLSHPQQLAVNVMLIAAAVLTGLAWELSPLVAAVLLGLAVIAWITRRVTSAMSRQDRQPADGAKDGRVQGSKP